MMTKFEEHKRLQEEIKSKRTELEVLERKSKELGECYITLSNGMIIEQPMNIFHWYANEDNYIQGNLFDSKEEAELEVKRRNLIFRFKRFRDECNMEWKPDWDTNDTKWSIAIDSKRMFPYHSGMFHEFATFGYFKHRADAENAIKLFGDEIKELYMGYEGD